MLESLDDLRRDTRVATEHTITVSFVHQQESGRAYSNPCRSQDISVGGLKILTHFPVPLGSIIPMEIDLGEQWAVIEVKAEVKWCLEIDDAPTFYIGVKLIDVDKSNLQVWKKFVQNL